MARVDCNKSEFWCWREECKKSRSCACNVCNPIKAINANLYDACVDACQADPRPTDKDSYLCKAIGPEVLFNRYGLIMCDFDPYETVEGELFVATEQKVAEKTKNQSSMIWAMGGVLLLLILVFIFK